MYIYFIISKCVSERLIVHTYTMFSLNVFWMNTFLDGFKNSIRWEQMTFLDLHFKGHNFINSSVYTFSVKYNHFG